jgi:hypothetical protein
MRSRSHGTRAPMNPDAYAGFLRLFLTPGGRLPVRSDDVDAYIRHLNRQSPLSRQSRRALGHTTDRAA